MSRIYLLALLKKTEDLLLMAPCNFSSSLVTKFTFKVLQWYQVQGKFEGSYRGDDFNISPGKWTGKLLDSELLKTILN